MSLSNVRFAQLAARQAKYAADWASDALDSNDTTPSDVLDRYIHGMQARLRFMAEEAGLPAARLTPAKGDQS